jgi:hypothetical protein
MHLILIIIILALLFPSVARIVGSLISALFWLIALSAVVALVQALFQ